MKFDLVDEEEIEEEICWEQEEQQEIVEELYNLSDSEVV